MLVTYQVATILGIIGGYLSAFALADSGSWRWMLGLAAVPALLVLPLLATMPDTARWYLLKGRVDDAGANPLPSKYPLYRWNTDKGYANFGIWVERAVKAAGK